MKTLGVIIKGESTHVGAALSVDELELLSLIVEEWELRQDAAPLEVIETVRTLRAGLEHAKNAGLEEQRKLKLMFAGVLRVPQ